MDSKSSAEQFKCMRSLTRAISYSNVRILQLGAGEATSELFLLLLFPSSKESKVLNIRMYHSGSYLYLDSPISLCLP